MSEGAQKDMLEEIFERQIAFMDKLVVNDKFPEYPVDLTSKAGQRLAKETIFNAIEEFAEASFTLKNRTHRVTDVRVLDKQHYLEEVCDGLAYVVELMILSGFSPQDVFNEYKRKNQVVTERLKNGY